MAIPQILPYDYFYQWRDKTNLIANNIGDNDDLETTYKATIVGAINEVFSEITTINNSILNCVITVNAQVDDVINVEIQFQIENTNITYPLNVRVYLSDNATGNNLISTAHDGGISIGTNGLFIPVIENKMGYVTTNTTGAFDLDIEETGAKESYLVVVMPDGRLVISDIIEHEV